MKIENIHGIKKPNRTENWQKTREKLTRQADLGFRDPRLHFIPFVAFLE